jgi:bla regulator protein blaR1
MNDLATIFNSSLVYCLGWTLVHFLWQGIIVGVIYVLLQRLLRGRSPTARYRLAMFTLSVMAVLPVITFIHLANTTLGISADETLHNFAMISASGENPSAVMPYSFVFKLQAWLVPLVPWTVPIWLAGVCAATLRVFRSWRQVHQLRETANFIPLKDWQATVESLCSRFGISKLVRLAVSAKVAVPSVIGWLKPIILIPPSAMIGLTPLQMELILTHELAHICRQDYLWNLLQLAVETLLFYHPVVRWVSHQGRLEREKCCDDMVIEFRGNTVEYARALTELESLRHSHSAFMLGADGGQVMARIQRLLGVSVPETPIYWLLPLLIAGILISTSIVQLNHHKTPVQSIFAARYTLLADAERPTADATVRSMSSVIPPIVIKQLHMIDLSTNMALKNTPSSAEISHPMHTIMDRPTATQNNMLAKKFMAGRVVETHKPVYPAYALAHGIEGSAKVEFVLTSEGMITNIHVTQVTGSEVFAQAAINALRRWKIAPAMEAGIPVTQSMTENFIFQIKNPGDVDKHCNIPLGYHICMLN